MHLHMHMHTCTSRLCEPTYTTFDFALCCTQHDGCYLSTRHIQVPFKAPNLWDNHPARRVGKIVDQAVKQQRPFLLNYFQNIDETLCMLADTRATHTTTATPEVLQTRYMDKMYIVLCNIPPVLHPQLRCFIEILHQAQIPKKWETGGVFVDWCNARMHSTPQCDITMKGVPTGNGVCPVTTIWSRWPHPWSQNCPTVLASMIPALSLKLC